jgi:hypothetical protein
MSNSSEKANIDFGPVCGGYLPGGAAIGVRSQSVRGCNATSSDGTGTWKIEPFDRTLSYDDMVLLFNAAPAANTIYGATAVIGPFVSTSGLTAPDFYIGSVFDDTPVAPVDIALAFEVKRIPRNT